MLCGTIAFVSEANHSMKTSTAGAAQALMQTRIIRAVASSTAIETGQPVKDLEALLKMQSSKFQQLSLAPVTP